MLSISKTANRFKRVFTGSSFIKHVLMVSSSAILTQFISLVVAPINTRLYRPSDYGLVAAFTAVFVTFTVLATMRYEMALPIAEDDVEGAHILLLCLLMALFWTTVTALMVWWFNKPIAHLLSRDPRFGRYLWFLPIGILTTSLFTIFSSWAVRKKEFKDLAVARIMQSVIGSTCTVTLGFLRFGALGLIIGGIIRDSSRTTKLALAALRGVMAVRPQLSLRGVLQAAKKHYRFPLFNSWSELLSTVSYQVPVLMLTRTFGETSTGYYALAQRILLLPYLFVSSALNPVFYSRAKQARDDGTISILATRMLKGIAGINAFFVVFVALFGERIFAEAFGARWSHAGVYASLMAPWLLLHFVVSPLFSLPLLYNRQGTDLFFYIALLIVRVGSIAVGAHYHNDVLAMGLFGVSSALFMLAYLAWLLQLVQVSFWSILGMIVRELALAVLLLGGCRVLLWWSKENYLLTGCALLPVLVFAVIRSVKQVKQGRAGIATAPVAV